MLFASKAKTADQILALVDLLLSKDQPLKLAKKSAVSFITTTSRNMFHTLSTSKTRQCLR